MNETILVGRGKEFSTIPLSSWKDELTRAPEQVSRRLDFMTADHHRVRNYCVEDLPRYGRPLPLERIAATLNLSAERTAAIVDDLERNLFFLVRWEQEKVSWAFPVTADQTGHQLRFSTGERLDAAWAEDAIAAPFVQGGLRDERLSVEISSSCGHCGRPLKLLVDSELNHTILEGGPAPLVFEPSVDWSTFQDRNIIDGY